MNRFLPGQRWISEAEPELGLGTILQAGGGHVQVRFAASDEARTYAAEHAPLKRVRFRAGDRIKAQDGREVSIQQVVERAGLLCYVTPSGELPEAQLSDTLSLHGPEDRLFAGRFDESSVFELRQRTLECHHRIRRSPVRGFLGGRIDLIPHQLYIAHEVAARHAPRVMLSDEVGLGKTIEAGLILHRLRLSGRADRILVLVPESLLHQWFVEMLRRFNVWLHIFDEPRCAAIEAGEPGVNPFLDDQLVLASLDFLAADPRRASQAADAGWDLLVVDEAHHLEWSPSAPSTEYRIVETISRRAAGLLLLTATPEQLGMESHFARLRLLDPDRYSDLAAFVAGAKDYRSIADVSEKLAAGRQLETPDLGVVRHALGDDDQLEARLRAVAAGDATARQELLDDLLDLHGPGRVIFRNTRSGMTGFPRRHARLARLDPGPQSPAWLDRVATEFAEDVGGGRLQPGPDLTRDPRLLWLVGLLRKLDPQKVLVICRRIEKVEAIDAALRRNLDVKTGIFHEGLTLLQRDRNAAWFAEPDGARLLICSEIGSEGRNFQFAQHLVLFDLPLNPELLEQRIGRLDRIGQQGDIEIHVPHLARSPQEVLARWYHDGLDAFEHNLEGGNELLRQFGRLVHDLALEFPVADPVAAEAELAGLLQRTREARHEIRRRLEQGRDRLLELNSFRPAIAQKLIAQIRATEPLPAWEEYLLDVFDHFGVRVEELAPRTWHLHPDGVITEAFPALPAGGVVATCDRQRAVRRDEVAFLTGDHPMVTGAMELLLGAETGNCAFAVLPAARERSLLLELVFVLEAVAAPRLHVDRFLPATPLRVVLNHKLEDLTAMHGPADWEGRLKPGVPFRLLDNPNLARRTLPAMLERGTTLAETRAAGVRAAALAEMRTLLGHEVHRLKLLHRVNDHIRPQEIQLAEAQQAELTAALQDARLRLDSLRLIWHGPADVLD
jgi:ATP-dependent helicase HepA